MKFGDKLDFVINILYWVLFAFLVWLTVICFGYGEFFNSAAGEATGSLPTDGNDPGAGYIMGAEFAIGVFAGITGFVLFFCGIFSLILSVIVFLVAFFAQSRRKKYKLSGNPVLIKKNLGSKLVLNSVILLFFIYLLVSEVTVAMALLTVLILAVEIMLIIARNQLKAILV